MGFDFNGVDVDIGIFLPPSRVLRAGVVPGTGSALAGSPEALRQLDEANKIILNPTQGYGFTLESREVVARSALRGYPGSSDYNAGFSASQLGFFRSIMTSMEVTQMTNGMPKVALVLEPPSNEMALSMLNSNILAYGNFLGLRFGYTKSPIERSPKLGFLMLKPDVQFGSTINFIVRGIGINSLLQKRADTNMFSFAASGRTAKQIVEEVIRPYGMELDDTPLMQAGSRSEVVIPGWSLTPMKVPMIGRSHFDFLNELLASLPGQIAYRIEGNKFIVFSSAAEMWKKPTRTFRWYGGLRFPTRFSDRFQSEDLPILDYSSDTDLTFYPGGAAKVTCDGGYHPDSGENKTTATSNALGGAAGFPATSPTTIAAESYWNGESVEGGRFGRFVKPLYLPGQTGLRLPSPAVLAGKGVDPVKMTQTINGVAQLFANYQIRIRTIGVPSLTPGYDLIRVTGFETVGTKGSDKLNGLFWVSEVKHTIGSNGYETELTAIRSGIPGEGVPSGSIPTKTSDIKPSQNPKTLDSTGRDMRTPIPVGT